MQAVPIITEVDYTRTLLEIRRLVAVEPDRGTPEGDRLDMLTAIAEAFELERDAPDLADIEAR